MNAQGFTAFTVRRPVTVLMLACATVAVGVIAYVLVPVELLPKGFVSEQASVFIPVASGTPMEVQEQIIRPTEEEIRTIPGVTRIQSRAGTSRANLRVEFSREVDIDLAVAELRDRVERARLQWPEQVRDYGIFRFNIDTDLPVFSFAVDLDHETDEVTFLVEEKIKKPVEALPGVARVTCWGLLEDQVRVSIHRDRALAQGVDIERLARKLSSSNVEQAAGEIQDGPLRLMVRTDARFRNVDDVRNFPVNAQGLRLSEIATIEPGKAFRDRVALARNKRSLWFQVNKESSANTVAVGDTVRRALIERIEPDPRLRELGARVRFYDRMDMGKMITGAIDTLKQSAGIGSVLAVLILFWFLRRLAPTLIIAISLPLSMLLAMGWIHFSGDSLNILSLLGLTVAVGMLVDNSIVVAENIARHRDLGAGRLHGAIEGTAEVALAVTLSTFTTMAAFLPVIFMSGDHELTFFTAGIGIPLCVAVAASLLVALLFIPLATVVFDRRAPNPAVAGAAAAARDGLGRRMYARTLSGALRHRLATVVLVGGAVWTLSAMAWESLPKTDVMSESGGWISMDVRLDPNFTLKDAYDVFREYGAWLEEHAAEYGVEHFWCFFDKRGGDFDIDLAHVDMAKSRETAKRLKEDLPRKPGVKVSLGIDEGRQSEDGKLSVDVFGPDAQVLIGVAKDIGARLEKVPGVLAVRPDLEEGEEEVHVVPDRERAARYGVGPEALRGTLEIGIHGWRFSDLILGEREIPLIIQYDGAQERDLAELRDFPVASGQGGRVTIESIADVTVSRGLGEIQRRDGRVQARISIDAADANREATRKLLREALAGYPLPEGYSFEETGTEKVEAGMEQMGTAGLMAIVFIFLLMGILFESFILPLAVLVTIPFSFSGAIWALALTKVPLDFVGSIGVLVLVGVVVNNGIVLIDCAHRLVQGGLGRTEALVEAGRTRLRPILMTALTTILGLLPTALGDSSGSQISYKALSWVVIGGLTVSTLFTLFFVPILHSLLDDLRELFAAAFRALLRRRPSASQAASAPVGPFGA